MVQFLADTHPHLRSEFLYTVGKDGKKDESKSFNVLRTYSKCYALWKCDKVNCEKKCEHVYNSQICNRTRNGCPFCAGKRVCLCNSFQTKQPNLMKEWHINPAVNPSQIAEKSGVMIWWKCLKSKCSHHIWMASPHNRVRNKTECPFCGGKQVCPCDSFETKQPEMTKEWGDNGLIKASDISEKSGMMIWWKCLKSKCGHHVWQATPNYRVSNKSGCPFCSNHRHCECYCLASEFPSLLNEEWDEKKNDEEGLDIFKLAPYAHNYAWWICKTCQYSWLASIVNRTHNERGCPKCSQSKMEKLMFNILKTLKTKNIIQSYVQEYILSPTKLRADFCVITLENEKIMVEMDGIQHFIPQNFGVTSRLKEEMFIEVQNNDKRKKEWCEQNNIRLLRISYRIKTDDYERELIDFIQSKNVFLLLDNPIFEKKS